MAKKLAWIVVLLAAPFGPPNNKGQSPLLVNLDIQVTNVQLTDLVAGDMFEYKTQLYVVEQQKRRSTRENKVLVRRVGYLNEWEKSRWEVSPSIVGMSNRLVVSRVEIHPDYRIGKTDEQRLADPKNIGK